VKKSGKDPKWNRNSNGCQMPQSVFAICRQSIRHGHPILLYSYLCIYIYPWHSDSSSHCHANLCQIQGHLCLERKGDGISQKVFYTVFYADLKYYGKPDLKQCGGLINKNITFSLIKKVMITKNTNKTHFYWHQWTKYKLNNIFSSLIVL